MYFFIIMFHSLINLMINKYTGYVIVLQCWNTAAHKHPTERENGPHYKKAYDHWFKLTHNLKIQSSEEWHCVLRWAVHGNLKQYSDSKTYETTHPLIMPFPRGPQYTETLLWPCTIICAGNQQFVLVVLTHRTLYGNNTVGTMTKLECHIAHHPWDFLPWPQYRKYLQ
jgi:hypothetical protein